MSDASDGIYMQGFLSLSESKAPGKHGHIVAFFMTSSEHRQYT